MKVSDAFNSLKSHDHSASFEGLGPWLDQKSKRPKPMKNFYKVAASLVATALILVACTVPVSHDEEIGYMIKGTITEMPEEGRGKIVNLSAVNFDEVQFTPVVKEFLHEDGTNYLSNELTEVVLLLPEANLAVAEQKLEALESVLSFETINLLPIEDRVERTLFESALHNTFDIKIDPELTENEIEERINIFLHENSSITENIFVEKDENGNRKAVFRVRMYEDAEGSSFMIKEDIEQLYIDLGPDQNLFVTEEEREAMKELEIQKIEEEKKKRDN